MQYKKGDYVIYGIHGRCEIVGIETKVQNQKELSFYELKPVVDSLKDSKFLIPVSKAAESGLRQEIDPDEVEALMQILTSPEFFIDLKLAWPEKEKEIERLVRFQGAVGLAKAIKHLYTYHNLTSFPEPVATKTYKRLFKVLSREIAQVMKLSFKETELLMTKALTAKTKKTQ